MRILGLVMAIVALVFAVVSGMSTGGAPVALTEGKGKAGCGGGGGRPPPPPPSNSSG